jgi:hypothetical protein
MCHIKAAKYDEAAKLIGQCPQSEASTHYMALLAAVKQGEASSIEVNLLISLGRTDAGEL